jgi:hypothetical protein
LLPVRSRAAPQSPSVRYECAGLGEYAPLEVLRAEFKKH